MKTPQENYQKLNDLLGLNIYLKREDLHKFSSHKGRSIPNMIKKYYKENNIKNFVISSSGNAALASIYSVLNHNLNNEEKINLTVFVGKNINKNKFDRLIAVVNNQSNISIEQVENPKQSAFQMDKANKAKNLRQSTDDNALTGYEELAKELIRIPNLKAIFIPTSSGTTAQALGETFIKLFTEKKIDSIPQIHIVQTSSLNTIAKEINKSKSKDELSLADAIVDKIAHRKIKVLEIIKKSSGYAWIINNEEIKNAQNILKDTCGLSISANAILSLAGLIQAQNNNWKFSKEDSLVCLITGL